MSRIFSLFGLIVVAIVAVVLYMNAQEPSFAIADDTLAIEGLFGTSIKRDEVTDMLWVSDIPGGTRTNGGSFLGWQKGSFNLIGLGAGKVFAKSGVSPHILVKLKSGYLILGHGDASATRELYATLKQWLPANDLAVRVADIDSAPVAEPRILSFDDLRELAAKPEPITFDDLAAFIGHDNLSGPYGWHTYINSDFAVQAVFGTVYLYNTKNAESDIGIDIQTYDIDAYLKDGSKLRIMRP